MAPETSGEYMVVLDVWTTGLLYAPSKSYSYELKVDIEGYLPILGGKDGVATIETRFSVTGLECAKGLRRAKHELSWFRSTLNGAALPFKLDNVKEFFPPSTIAYSDSNKVMETNAPKAGPPATLPGLDVRRFPEMTYLPIEFASAEATSWEFERTMDGAPMRFSVKRLSSKDGVETLSLTAKQTQTTYEDDAKRRVSTAEGAAYKVETHIEADGTVRLLSGERIVDSLELRAHSNGSATRLKDGVVTPRIVATRVQVRRL